MADAGGSAAAWQVLLLVRARQWDTQAAMAEAMGITGAPPPPHRNALGARGLVRGWGDPGNRRVQQVELTEAGEALFQRLRDAARQFDKRLRRELGDEQVAELGVLL